MWSLVHLPPPPCPETLLTAPRVWFRPPKSQQHVEKLSTSSEACWDQKVVTNYARYTACLVSLSPGTPPQSVASRHVSCFIIIRLRDRCTFRRHGARGWIERAEQWLQVWLTSFGTVHETIVLINRSMKHGEEPSPRGYQSCSFFLVLHGSTKQRTARSFCSLIQR